MEIGVVNMWHPLDYIIEANDRRIAKIRKDLKKLEEMKKKNRLYIKVLYSIMGVCLLLLVFVLLV